MPASGCWSSSTSATGRSRGSWPRRSASTRAPPNLDDVGTFPFRFETPDEVEYPKKDPKPYMELYDNHWWFLEIFTRTALVGRFVKQLWPNLAFLIVVNGLINFLSFLGVQPPPDNGQYSITQGLIGTDFAFLLHQYRSLIQPIIGPEYGQTGFCGPHGNRPVDRRRSPVHGQQ